MSMDQPSTSPTSPRPRSRTFSFRSDKSGGSRPKVDLVESPKEKERRGSIWKGDSKANPNAAITEDQPAVQNLVEKTTIQPLRDLQHKDVHGNAIADPDLSNPTRPRMERPLDTIRSFEKAIDDGYKRRSSYVKAQSYDQNNQYSSRRTSAAYDANRYSQAGGYYGNQRAESNMGAPNGMHRPRYGAARMQSDPVMYGRPHPQTQHNYHQSQDTMNTGATNGSDSTGPWPNSTDPSSENSSIERNQAAGRVDMYSQSGYGHGGNAYGNTSSHQYEAAIPEEQGVASYAEGQQNGYGSHRPPANNVPRRPIPLGNTGGVPPAARPGNLPSTKRAEPDKRKSWFGRKLSKNK